jgi:hypothetical protein
VSSLADLEPFLARVAEHFEATGSAAEIYDRDWNLAWLTSQFRFFAGDRPLEQLGLGEHPVTVRTQSLDGMVPFETGIEWMRKNIPLMAHDTPGGMDAIRALLPDEHDRAIGPLDPQPPETLWWGELTYLQAGLPPAQTRYFTFALHDSGGERVGWAILYLPAAPASIVSLITRGNQGMFARMAELLEPARHETAILFADIQAPVVERLDLDDAHALGLDPLSIMYRTVGELPGVTPKAVRDAGGVPVVAVPRRLA